MKAAGSSTESYALMGPITQFWLGGTLDAYRAAAKATKIDGADAPSFPDEDVAVDSIIGPADGYGNTTSLNYIKQDLMLKISNYVPPKREELKKQMIVVDSYYKALGVPQFFYDYYKSTFIIKAYTCDALPPTEFNGIQNVYTCYCNNGDYHSLPDINFEVKSLQQQFDLSAQQYLLEPYLNYTRPISLCLLGLDTVNEKRDGYSVVRYGQRTMSSFPLMVEYDRDNKSAMMNLGGISDMPDNQDMTMQLIISFVIVFVLFVMLVYLIHLRRNRIKAEEWLEQNKSILFNSALGLKSEEEILEALVKSQKMQEKMNQTQ